MYPAPSHSQLGSIPLLLSPTFVPFWLKITNTICTRALLDSVAVGTL
jgi:hypothetical protein